MFKNLAKKYEKLLSDYQPFPNIDNRQYWENISGPVKSSCLKLAQPYVNFSYPPLPATLFMNFCRNGNRTDYEDSYFLRRVALNNLVIAECIENKGHYLDDIINGIFVLCEETAWQLPAHNSYIRDTPSHLLGDHSNPILDLFACETGALLATIDYVMGSRLDLVSPTIRQRIKDELDQRIIRPYLHKHFWWMGHKDEPMNNWTIWCTQNILLTFFMTKQPHDLRHEAFIKASKSIDYFLKEYGLDGCCDEGALYYRHAGLCLFNSIEILDSISNGFYQHLYQEEKIQNICSYIYNVHVGESYYINFADCAAILEPSGVREFLFAKYTQNIPMMNYAAKDFQKAKDPLMSSQGNLFYRLQTLQHYKEVYEYESADTITPSDIYYPSAGLLILRDSTYTLAVKAGDNDDSHNHNDTGSFIIYKDKKPLFVDIGVESYTAKTFSKDRYDIWTMQSDYHNLPTINGHMQLPGPDYKASSVNYLLDEKTPYIQMDIAPAYPKIDGVLSFNRKIQLNKNNHIQIQDELVTDTRKDHIPLISNLITYEKPEIQGSKLLIGNLAIVNILGVIENIDITSLPITDPRLKQSWDRDLYRIQIHYSSPTLGLIIE